MKKKERSRRVSLRTNEDPALHLKVFKAIAKKTTALLTGDSSAGLKFAIECMCSVRLIA